METRTTAKQAVQGLLAQAKKNQIGIATLTIVTIACTATVAAFRRPGQMSVIEAQAMDMTTMVPPKGAHPVGMITVAEEDIAGSVVYTGTVQAFADEDVHARVAGRIVEMPVYPGDRVERGQLVVRLDPPAGSEYAARLEAARYSAQAAARSADMAASEREQKAAQLKATAAAAQAAVSEVEAAKAQLDFWSEQLRRQQQLFAEGIVSRRDYDKDIWEYKQAKAHYDLGKAKQIEAESTKLAAQSALEASLHHAGHESDEARQAEAMKAEADAINNYTRITADDAAVVVSRHKAPGVVVSPGELLLKLAHIDRVRVQAQVSTSDINQLELGGKVKIKRAQDDKDAVPAEITAIFPAADPQTRTFTVEALIDNVVAGKQPASTAHRVKSARQYRLLPGQYVVMTLSTKSAHGLAVPTSALVYRQGQPFVWRAIAGRGSSKRDFTCPMHPDVHQDHAGSCPQCGMTLQPQELGGQARAQLVAVTTGAANAEMTEIKTGLAAGDRVIYAGYSDLSANAPVVATDWQAGGPADLPKAAIVAGDSKDLTAAPDHDHHHHM